MIPILVLVVQAAPPPDPGYSHVQGLDVTFDKPFWFQDSPAEQARGRVALDALSDPHMSVPAELAATGAGDRIVEIQTNVGVLSTPFPQRAFVLFHAENVSPGQEARIQGCGVLHMGRYAVVRCTAVDFGQAPESAEFQGVRGYRYIARVSLRIDIYRENTGGGGVAPAPGDGTGDEQFPPGDIRNVADSAEREARGAFSHLGKILFAIVGVGALGVLVWLVFKGRVLLLRKPLGAPSGGGPGWQVEADVKKDPPAPPTGAA